MKDKVFGIATPFIITVGILLIGSIVGVIAGSTSDGWAALGALLMVFMLGGFSLIIFLIVSIVLYSKRKTIYWLWVLYGYGALGGIITLLVVFISTYNMMLG